MPRPQIPHRRERILDAAQTLILERGFDGMSMSALAERCGIGKGALYLEFAGKNELVDQLIARSMRRITTALSARLAADGVASLGDLYRVVAAALLGDDLLTAAYLDDEGVLGGYAATRADDRYQRRFAWMDGYLRLLQRDGSLDADLDPDALSLALAAFTVGLLSLSKVVGPLSPERLAATIGAFATIVDRAVTPADAPAAMSPAAYASMRDLLDRLTAENDHPDPRGPAPEAP
ncbi:TetR/AcrR family transcriptional regulator [Spongiactinospora gelatinilytica]|uniref:TetR/AcrR family transcriptional regulator n=1 Tax=Spongiactinospora gelatinilytica TaxID=2666298 RepID=A0A2W2HBE9_9ACTN|nr:TetR/AcrR family transcriptional regulator [Spongiactinospora gelatinilytica]PZG52249.1 TetR/AcrR family transcriptional regulator [Spongiactinospora gelatinilytica]